MQCNCTKDFKLCNNAHHNWIPDILYDTKKENATKNNVPPNDTFNKERKHDSLDRQTEASAAVKVVKHDRHRLPVAAAAEAADGAYRSQVAH